MKALATFAMTLFAAGALWAGGELHRGNCIDSGNVSCSVLPWDNGAAPPLMETNNTWGLTEKYFGRSLTEKFFGPQSLTVKYGSGYGD